MTAKLYYLHRSRPYDTLSEVYFITGLGLHTLKINNREKLLRLYLESMKTRVVWDNIDKEVMLDVVCRALKDEISLKYSKRELTVFMPSNN